MTISATPGSAVSATLQLPQAATDVVRWRVTSPSGATIADGQQPATGTLVYVQFVMPSSAAEALDGSEYQITASDGVTSTRETIALVTTVDPADEHSGEVAYSAGTPFTDSLVSEGQLASAQVTVQLVDGTLLATQTVDVTKAVRLGDAWLYPVTLGVVDTATATSYGIGTVLWQGILADGTQLDPQYHAFWTITPYTASIALAIRKLVDRARIGDINSYLEVRPVDLANAVVRGMEFVISSAPLSTPFALDQIPISLRDYVIKAGAVDLLRAQYEAEGMSAFDFQGQGTQLQVDRSQYIDGLAQQIQADLATLPQAKGLWIQQGMPMGATLVPGKRPIGVLGLTTGTYSTFKIQPFLLGIGGEYSFIAAQKRRYQIESLRLTGTGAASPGAPGLPNPSLPTDVINDDDSYAADNT